MPKVSNCRIQINGQYQQFDIYYNKGEKFYVKNFPEEVLKIGKDEADKVAPTYGFATEQLLIENLKKIVDQYHTKIKSQRHVILVQMNVTRDCFMNKTGHGSWSGLQKWVSEDVKISTIPNGDYGFSFSFEHLLEVEENGKKYYIVKEDGEIGYDRHVRGNEILIDFTEDRYSELCKLAEATHKLIAKIGEVITNKDKLSHLLDNGTKLLKQ